MWFLFVEQFQWLKFNPPSSSMLAKSSKADFKFLIQLHHLTQSNLHISNTLILVWHLLVQEDRLAELANSGTQRFFRNKPSVCDSWYCVLSDLDVIFPGDMNCSNGNVNNVCCSYLYMCKFTLTIIFVKSSQPTYRLLQVYFPLCLCLV